MQFGGGAAKKPQESHRKSCRLEVSMPPKGKKKSPNEPALIPEDTYQRILKLKDNKVAVKPPKGEFTKEEWCTTSTNKK